MASSNRPNLVGGRSGLPGSLSLLTSAPPACPLAGFFCFRRGGVSKNYAARLEMNRPGGALYQPRSIKSRSSNKQQSPRHYSGGRSSTASARGVTAPAKSSADPLHEALRAWCFTNPYGLPGPLGKSQEAVTDPQPGGGFRFLRSAGFQRSSFRALDRF
jgi:hypothetical protein